MKHLLWHLRVRKVTPNRLAELSDGLYRRRVGDRP